MLKPEYLNTLPEAENEFHVELEQGEKVVFASKLSAFGDERDQSLGITCTFTLTN